MLTTFEKGKTPGTVRVDKLKPGGNTLNGVEQIVE